MVTHLSIKQVINSLNLGDLVGTSAFSVTCHCCRYCLFLFSLVAVFILLEGFIIGGVFCFAYWLSKMFCMLVPVLDSILVMSEYCL